MTRDVSLKELRSNNDSVLLASGCHFGNVVGEKTNKIESDIGFLKDVKTAYRLGASEEGGFMPVYDEKNL